MDHWPYDHMALSFKRINYIGIQQFFKELEFWLHENRILDICFISFQATESLTYTSILLSLLIAGGHRMVRLCWVNLKCRNVLLIWIIVGHRPIAFAVGADGYYLAIFHFIYLFSFLSPLSWRRPDID